MILQNKNKCNKYDWICILYAFGVYILSWILVKNYVFSWFTNNDTCWENEFIVKGLLVFLVLCCIFFILLPLSGFPVVADWAEKKIRMTR